MPIYEFRCRACGTRQSHLFRSFAASESARCTGCGGELDRLVSRVAVHRSLASIHEESGPPRTDPGYYRDPRNIGRAAEETARTLGMELPGEVRGMIDAAREGDLPAGIGDL